MSRPSKQQRKAEAEKWMKHTFGNRMYDYVASVRNEPISVAVTQVTRVLQASNVNKLISQWQAEDAKSRAGRKSYISAYGALALILLQVFIRRETLIVSMTHTLHQLSETQRKVLGLDHVINEYRSYDRIWRSVQRLMALVDEFYIPEGAPRARHRILRGDGFKTLKQMRDPNRCELARKRMGVLANTLLEGTLQLLPKDLRDKWTGNIAFDATFIPLPGKTGNPSSSILEGDRQSINPDGGFYGRDGNHGVVTHADARVLQKKGKKVKGTSKDKRFWGIEAEVARTVDDLDNSRSFPQLTAAMGFHIPGAITGAGYELLESIHDRGHNLDLVIFDRAYSNGKIGDFHVPARLLGAKLVFDYKDKDLGTQAHDARGFVQVSGSWYLDSLPAPLREADRIFRNIWETNKREVRALESARKAHKRASEKVRDRGHRATATAINELTRTAVELKEAEQRFGAKERQVQKAKELYRKQQAQRELYRLKPKGKMFADGSRRYIVPDVSNNPLVPSGPHRFTNKTVTLTPDLTAATETNPTGLKHEQYFPYGTELWARAYGLRNSVESTNRNIKRSQFENLGSADDRATRGNTFSYIVAAAAAVSENLRQLINFFKERIANKPLTVKNRSIPDLFSDTYTGNDPPGVGS